jgi:enoyl-CoA hydratase/carnithine racemase
MQFGDVSVDVRDDQVATVEIHRPPNNHFDIELIRSLADAYGTIDDDPACRVIVLAAEGKHFCAGADFGGGGGISDERRGNSAELYAEAVRLFGCQTPVVAAVQGAAIGGGLGLACSADFRVAAPEARFSANFARLGFHQGFGLSVTLPLIVGHQKALELLYTGARINGEEAHRIGLADRLAPLDEVRAAATAFAADIAVSAPLAVRAIRQTMRGSLAGEVDVATEHENEQQAWLRQTADFAEGVRATAERRAPRFEGR